MKRITKPHSLKAPARQRHARRLAPAFPPIVRQGRALAGLLLGLLLASCSVMDYEGDCTPYYRARFTYDMHLHYADAFANQVTSVALYAFDEDGRFVARFTDSGEALAADGYSLPLDLPAGTYHFVAWCGLEHPLQSHDVPELTPGVSTLDELTCTVSRQHEGDGSTATAGELAPTFHSLVTSCTLPDSYGTHYVDIPLVKDTKTVRVVLQHLNGEPIDVDGFSFSVTCANGLMAHDNSLLPDETLHYRPYYTASGTAEVQADGTRATTAISTALAEMSTGRLVCDGRTPAVLSVTNNKTGDVVLSIPLMDYALLVKGYYNRDMSDQEYLDRQDEYNLTFFLDSNNHWVNSTIIINSWRVVLDDVEL